jgi:hypothetical protein
MQQPCQHLKGSIVLLNAAAASLLSSFAVGGEGGRGMHRPKPLLAQHMSVKGLI